MYKKIIKKTSRLLVVLVMLVGINSCETTQLEILENPNALAPSTADVDFYLNAVQLDLATFFEQITEEGMEVTRMLHMFGPIYSNAYNADQFNAPYSLVYSDILSNARALRPNAEEAGLFTHLAISKVIEAYVMMTMVDYFGPVPYSEAVQGTDFLNPNVDSGQDIYNALEILLDEAIADFNMEETLSPANDLYYGGDEDKWIALANTLKLKMYVQSRLVNDNTSKINTIVNSGNYITSTSGDFEFEYSTVNANPDSRHPIFVRNFNVSADAADYMSNSYMYQLVYEYSTQDPRTRYYFYRQQLMMTDQVQEAECISEEEPPHYDLELYPFCWAGNFDGEFSGDQGYWGRDHGDPDGIPPDGGKRTTWGVYPVGGPFDAGEGGANPGMTSGLQGIGISPIMLASYVDFMLAESALTEGTTGDARDYLESGIRKSINKVIDFGSSIADEDLVPTDAQIDGHVLNILNDYDSEDNDGKLNVIVKQYIIALFGNGVEAYNTYRRTCKPENIQPTIVQPDDGFIRSFLYPNELVEQNINVSQKAGDHTEPVFWDTNSCNLN